MDALQYYAGLCSQLEALKNSLPDFLTAEERRALLRRIELTRSQAAILYQALRKRAH